MRRLTFPFGFALVALPLVGSFDSAFSADLAKQVAALDGRVIIRGKVARQPMAKMLARHVAGGLRQANFKDRAAWAAVKTKKDWERMRDARIGALRKSLGQYPKASANPKIQVTRTVKGNGFEVDNLVFESRPGVVVTANLYRPAQPSKSMPGIVVCHSHHRPKHSGARQAMGATWARAGCVVYVPDHLGHGERQQHPFRKNEDYKKAFRLSYQDYYSRYDMGIQLYLIGDSLMGWLAWDMSRGLDVLLKQPGVDAKQIMVISDPAGGGDVAAVTAALDPRISGVMVNNFGGPEPEDGYPLPKDVEQSFSYTGSGSWESTRSLRLSARDGFLPWTIVASVAPRRLIYYHEFYWDRHHDPVWKRLQKVFGFYAVKQNLAGLAGHGFVVGSSPENTHWTPYSRQLLYPVLEKWFGIPNPKQEYGKLLPEEQLICLTPQAREFKPEPLYRLCAELGKERAAAARRGLEKLSLARRRERLRKDWTELLGRVDSDDPPVVLKQEPDQLDGIRIDRIQLMTEPGIIVPLIVLAPQAKSAQPRCVVAVAQAGKQAFLRHRSREIAQLLDAGATVCLLDVRGTGETAPGDHRQRRSSATTLAASNLMLGQTLLGGRLHDVNQVLRHLRRRDDLKAAPFTIWGDSFAPVNAQDDHFVVPRGIADRPANSEPLGGLLALLTGLADDRIDGIYVNGGLATYQDAIQAQCYLPFDVVVPGILTAGDLCDVVAAQAPRKIRLNGMVDGLNRRLRVADVRRQYLPAVKSYQQANADSRLSITNDSSIASWLLEKVEKE